jgi:uncharacterized membrane protein
MNMNTTVLIISTLFSGLMAGLFYAWSISVTPGLARVNDMNYLQAFQSMNRAILNPVFFIVFMGLPVLLLLLSYLFYSSEISLQFVFVISTTVVYITGVMGVTIFGNIPLNNALESLNIQSMNHEQMTTFRLGFESKWNKLNIIRTICSSLSFLLLIIVCIQNNSN